MPTANFQQDLGHTPFNNAKQDWVETESSDDDIEDKLAKVKAQKAKKRKAKKQVVDIRPDHLVLDKATDHQVGYGENHYNNFVDDRKKKKKSKKKDKKDKQKEQRSDVEE